MKVEEADTNFPEKNDESNIMSRLVASLSELMLNFWNIRYFLLDNKNKYLICNQKLDYH